MAARVNPFVYGEIVPSSAFVDREVELHRLVADLAAGQKVFLISPRRYGKSSLVRHALGALGRQRMLTVELVVSSYSSYLSFLEGYASHVIGHEPRVERGRSWAARVFDSFRPELRVETRTGKGRLAVRFPTVRSEKDESRLAEEVFHLAGRLAEESGRRVIVALDEFQAINEFNGRHVEAALRAVVQQQRQVGYVFAGSEPTLMEQMVAPDRPFYKAGPVMHLGRIRPDAFAAFIDTGFRRTGFRVEPGFGEAVVELAGNLPYDVQRLAHETWDDAKVAGLRTVGVEALHATLRRLLAEHDPLYETTWQRLTLAQRAVARAVVVERGQELLSADVRARYRLGGASSVQAALAALQRLDIVARAEEGNYTVVDSLLREWIARRTF
jgi:hypothetical protein